MIKKDQPTNQSLLRGRVYAFRASQQALHPPARLVMFTDAILAIAATVLVLNLVVQPDTRANGLAHQLGVQGASLLSVMLGFLWIIGAWVLSHRALRQLRGVDHYMTLLVMASTVTITLIPFATQLLAHGYGHSDFWIGVEAVSVVVLLGSALSAIGTNYAHRHNLITGRPDNSQRRTALTIWYIVLGLMALSCLLAPVAPWVALSIVVLTRVSALLPLASDRFGYGGMHDESGNVTNTPSGAEAPLNPHISSTDLE